MALAGTTSAPAAWADGIIGGSGGGSTVADSTTPGTDRGGGGGADFASVVEEAGVGAVAGEEVVVTVGDLLSADTTAGVSAEAFTTADSLAVSTKVAETRVPVA